MPFELRQPLKVHRAVSAQALAATAASPAVHLSPTVLALTPPVASVRPATGRWIDPRIFEGIEFTVNPNRPRSSFHLPALFTSDPNPSVATLFEEPEDPTHRRYVPAYTLATTRRATSDVRWVALAPGEAGTWVLTVHLAPGAPPQAPPGATVAPLPPEIPVRYAVKATAPQTGQLLSWDFDEIAEDGATLRLTLHLRGDDAITQRDHLFRAMTDPAARAVLSIAHTLSLAVPSASGAPGDRPAGPRPATAVAPLVGPTLPASAAAAPRTFLVRRALPHDAVAAIPLEMGFRFPRDPGTTPPEPTPLFRTQTTVVAREIPFTFDRDLDANVFEQLVGLPAGNAGLNHLTSTWEGRAYPYFQEADQPEVFYFLPDAFKIARRPAAPFHPLLSVAIDGATIEAARFTLSYWAAPVWDPRRIEAAAADLAPHAAPKAPTLVPFDAAQPKLRLKLPGEAGPAFVEQEGALINLVAGIHGSVTLGLTPFQRAYSALFDSVGELLSGEVLVQIGTDTSSIPFTARANDLVGEIFERSEELDSASGGLKLTLRNAIESPIAVQGLRAALVQGATTLPAEIRSTEPPLPATLAPAGDSASGATLVVVVAPTAGGPVDATFDALFDLQQVAVQPDPQRLWDTILDRSIAPMASRGVTVKLPAATFAANAPKPLLAVQIEFQTGGSASFEAPATAPAGPFLTQDVQLPVPLADFVLARADAGGYHYRVRTVSASAIEESEWKAGSSDVLFVVVG